MPKYFLLLLLTLTLGACELVGDIFKVGLWAGLVIAVIAIALISWLIHKLRRGP